MSKENIEELQSDSGYFRKFAMIERFAGAFGVSGVFVIAADKIASQEGFSTGESVGSLVMGGLALYLLNDARNFDNRAENAEARLAEIEPKEDNIS